MAEENPHPLPRQVQRSAPLRARSHRCWCCREREPGPEIVHDYMKPQKGGPGPSQRSVELQGRPTTVACGHPQAATLLRQATHCSGVPLVSLMPLPCLDQILTTTMMSFATFTQLLGLAQAGAQAASLLPGGGAEPAVVEGGKPTASVLEARRKPLPLRHSSIPDTCDHQSAAYHTHRKRRNPRQLLLPHRGPSPPKLTARMRRSVALSLFVCVGLLLAASSAEASIFDDIWNNVKDAVNTAVNKVKDAYK